MLHSVAHGVMQIGQWLRPIIEFLLQEIVVRSLTWTASRDTPTCIPVVGVRMLNQNSLY